MNLEKTCSEYKLVYSTSRKVFRYQIEKHDFSPAYSKRDDCRPGYGLIEAVDVSRPKDRESVFLARAKVLDLKGRPHYNLEDDVDILPMNNGYFEVFDYLKNFLREEKPVLLDENNVSSLFLRKEFLSKNNFKKMVDEELIIHSLLGSQDTFCELHNRYLPVIQWKVTGFNIPAHDSLDLIQIGRIYLWKSLEGYSGKNKATFKKFFSKSLVNHLIDLRRVMMAQKRNPPKQGKGGKSNFSYDTLMGRIMLENFCARAWQQEQQNQ